MPGGAHETPEHQPEEGAVDAYWIEFARQLLAEAEGTEEYTIAWRKYIASVLVKADEIRATSDSLVGHENLNNDLLNLGLLSASSGQHEPIVFTSEEWRELRRRVSNDIEPAGTALPSGIELLRGLCIGDYTYNTHYDEADQS